MKNTYNKRVVAAIEHIEIAKSNLIDADSTMYEGEIEELQKIQNTLLHLEYYVKNMEDN